MTGSRTKGLTAFQIKVIALVCMTLDHIASFGFEIPVVARYDTYLRAVGRIAAPLFLFLLAESVRHTKSKPKFVLRLYLAGMGVGLFDAAMNLFFGDVLGYRTPGNIIFTFFYAALHIVLIEGVICAWQDRYFRKVALLSCVLILSLIPSIFFNAIYHAVPMGDSMASWIIPQQLRSSLIPSFYDVDYGIGLVVLGVVFYFVKTKKRQCCVFALFCLLCVIGAIVGRYHYNIYRVSLFGFTNTFLDFFQCRMVLALPFMALYNGERGRGYKWFFYGYYPLHRQLIVIISALVT